MPKFLRAWLLLGLSIATVGASWVASASAGETSLQARVGTVWCRGTTMTGDRGLRPPATLPTTVPTSMAAAYRAYYFNGAVVVAPRGWSCTGASGSNGARVNVSEGIEAAGISGYVATPGNHSLFLACTAFRMAEQRLTQRGLPGDNCFLKVGPETTIRRTPTLVTITTAHTGEGGRLTRTIHRIWWIARREAAAQLTCYMASPLECDTAYRDFNRRVTMVR